MVDDEEEIFITDVIEHCIKKKNFSCAYIQTTFEMPYPLAARVIEACEDMGIIKEGKNRQEYISLDEWKKNYKKYIKTLIKKNLFKKFIPIFRLHLKKV